MSLKLVVFHGSVRRNRQGIKAARFIVEQCRAPGHEVTLLDAAELELPLSTRCTRSSNRARRQKICE